jgi:hypothetical protein
MRFAATSLEADQEPLRGLPRSAFRRAPAARNSLIKHEVVVTFATTQDRDLYKSLAYKLGGNKDLSIRLEIPNHLLGQHRVLNAAGQELRSGRPGCRTSIKFDDDGMRMVLDYRIKDGPWKRLCPDQAAAAVGKEGRRLGIEETSAEEFKDLLTPLSGSNATPLG